MTRSLVVMMDLGCRPLTQLFDAGGSPAHRINNVRAKER